MNSELAQYIAEFRRLIDRITGTLEGLDSAQLNWRPPAPDANSLYVILAHVLGNLEAWVLGIACAQAIRRDRPAEFASAGPDIAPLAARARGIAGQIEEALTALPPEALDQVRRPSKELWGESEPEPVSVRWAIMHAIEHAAIHLGQIQITRDLALAISGGRS